MSILLFFLSWIFVIASFAPAYLVLAIPFLLYSLYEQTSKGGPVASTISVTSIPAMAIKEETVYDYVNLICDNQKKKAFQSAIQLMFKLKQEVYNHPEMYPKDSKFVVSQIERQLKNDGVDNCIEVIKFMTLLKKEVNT
jgi:predicted metal-dependent TIM-barrel fold hydrolase